MMLPRKLTEAMPEAFARQTELADRLFANNQAFFYGAYHVDVLRS